MADPIQRPRYHEGQILAARDLTRAVDYGRGKHARHGSRLHTWGIAAGLALHAEEQRLATGETYVEVTVRPGMAVDGTGRELVLIEPRRLNENAFRRSNVEIEDLKAWYPVLVRGSDVPAADTGAGPANPCGDAGAQATRVTEAVDIVFGRPGSAADLDEQVVPAIGEEADVIPSWRILLGYVQWDAKLDRFKAVSATQDGIGRRYAGVRADEVEARSGTLALRSRPVSQPGATAVHVDPEALRFGLQDGSGGLTEVFSVNRQGEIAAAGKPVGGGIRVESGLISDGMRVPLPAGITEAAVAAGEVILNIQITPVVKEPPPSEGGNEPFLWMPGQLFVDSGRGVHCTVRVVYAEELIEIPSFCSYTVIAYTAGIA